MGTGKTIPMLVHADNLITLGEVDKVLWVGPVTAYDVVAKNLELLPQRRQDRVNEHMTIINYDKLSRGGKAATDLAFIDWDMIILDEIHKIARPQSKRTQYFVGKGDGLGMARHAKYRYGLTGTPINQSRYQDLWAYMRFMFDDNYMTYRDFKHRYLKMFTLPETHISIVSGYSKHVGELKDEVAHHVQYKKTAECQDLPPMLPDEIITVPWRPGRNDLGASTEKMYFEALESYVDCLDMVMDNPLAKMTKLRQIASGSIRDDEGKDHQLNSHKTTYMVDLIENHGGKVVVFFEYKATRKMLTDALDKKKISYYTLDGSQKDKGVWKKFQDPADDTRVFIAQYQSGSESIDLWASHMTIFAEPCLSFTSMQQARKRTNREGQSQPCSYYFMCTEGSIDFDIYTRLCAHQDFDEKFYRDIARKTLTERKRSTTK